MSSQTNLTAALLEVRAYLAQEAQAEDFRNEAAWEAGSSREEHAASDALTRLDEVLRQVKAQQRPNKEDRAQSRNHDRVRLHHAHLAA
ncbi:MULTISPECIES: hypothetical protein [Xanthobacter]|jgi:hypothetical protein|uniref:Uncharacterized protein n=1 Tax=Xanthobacter aminoxidans TaxID=186280 RepID=A0ABW6ZCH3_9HYPH